MLRNYCKCIFATDLESYFAPRCLPQRRAVFAASPGKGVKFCPDEDRYCSLGCRLDASSFKYARHSFPARCLRPALCQMIEQGKCVSFTTAKLGGEIKNGRGFN